MIYLCRLPRVCAMLTVACGLLAIGGSVFLVNVVWAGFTSESWNEAIARMDGRESLR